MTEKYALLIGCNYINTPNSRLYGCITDVKNMSNMLITNMGFKTDNITILRDDIIGDLCPTKEVILRELNNIITKSNNAKEIWIHYSGHGSVIKDKNRDEITGYDSCIVPVDYMTSGFIIDDDILKILSLSKCPTFIITDCCHSGTICDLPYSIEYISGTNFKYTRNNKASISNSKIVMVSGCKDNQTSADFFDAEHGQNEGAFTDSFLRALKRNNYNADLSKIYVDTYNWLSSNGFSQKPLLSSSIAKPNWIFGTPSSIIAKPKPNPPRITPYRRNNRRTILPMF